MLDKIDLQALLPMKDRFLYDDDDDYVLGRVVFGTCPLQHRTGGFNFGTISREAAKDGQDKPGLSQDKPGLKDIIK